MLRKLRQKGCKVLYQAKEFAHILGTPRNWPCLDLLYLPDIGLNTSLRDMVTEEVKLSREQL